MAAQKGWQIVWVEEMAQELKAKALGKELTRKEFDSILEKIEQAELPDEPSRQKDEKVAGTLTEEPKAQVTQEQT
ncbi:unnamed protein product [Durusdinium trenchii]|uniref:Uncharacterized protein n=1 Tax=Durusdinium trenchii TaxID=1381693 RepID=A0ABP0S859_9DINO